MNFPKGTACQGLIGHVSARSLINAFSHKGQLAQHFFVENPRHYLGDNERYNPGAAGLEKALKSGKGQEVLLCHNGVVITALLAKFENGALEIVAPQIINGCQSCYTTLDRNKEHLEDVYPARHQFIHALVGISPMTHQTSPVMMTFALAASHRTVSSGLSSAS